MSLDVLAILMGLVGGLALFLFGMEQMSEGLQKAAGSSLKKLLGHLTSNRFAGAFTGAVVTGVIQSSSITTVLVVGFVSAGLMSLAQSIAVIMGANVGTTVTAQIVAFKVTQYALMPVAIGFAMQFVGKTRRIKQYGSVIMGLGLIFFGMDLMGAATNPLRSYQPFIDWMGRMESPALGIVAATVFTAIVQSSSAAIGVVIVLAGQGFISLEAGIALVFGANIGTCVTALLASIGKPREAVQVAVTHVLLKVVEVAIWLPFIDQLAEFTAWLSPSADHVAGIERMAAETPRQVANAHTIFNVANTLIFIWFITPLSILINKLIPKRTGVAESASQPKYLDELLLKSPDLALDRTRMEIGRLGALVVRMVQDTPAAMLSGRHQDLDRLREMDQSVDGLHGAIVDYLGTLSRRDLSPEQSSQLSLHLSAVNYLESIGDMVETNLTEAGIARIEASLTISEETASLVRMLHAKVLWAVTESIRGFVDSNPLLGTSVIEAKEDINTLVDQAETHLAHRLAADAPNRLQAFQIETQIIENLKRVYYFAKRIAKLSA